MDTRDRVAAIVVNWNAGNMLQRSITSLTKQTRCLDRIIVVDNNSQDRSLDHLAPFGLRIEILRLQNNTGFAAANNVGIAKASDCEWVALLNPDAIAEPNWLKYLLDAAATNPAYTSFASRMLCSDNPSTLDGAGDVYHFTGFSWRRGYGWDADRRYLRPEEVFSACAGAALYHRDALMEIGGFDESFFCYMEDVDLGFRLRLRGHHCLYVPTAVVRHVGSASTGKNSDVSVYYGHRNLVWVFFKNMPASLLVLFLLPHVLANMFSIAAYAVRGRERIILRAKYDAIEGLRHIFRQRKQVQRKRTNSAWRIAKTLSYRL